MSIHAKVLGCLGATSRIALLLTVWCAHLPSARAQDSSELVSAALLDPGTAALDNAYSDTFGDAERALREGLGSPGSTAPTAKAAKTTLVSATGAPRVKNQDSVESRSAMKPLERETFTEPTTANAAIDNAAAALMKPTGANTVQSRTPSEESPSTIKILQKKLSASELHVKDLEQQLSEAKSRLIAAEVEINRLSNLEGSAARAKFKTSANEPARGAGYQDAQGTGAPRIQMPPGEDARALAPKTDLHVATVVVEKADLRLGPGKNNSALMSLRKGSRLMVEERQGEWYRVYAPNGERAWIHSSLVRFGDGAASLNDGSSVKIRGFDPSVEQEVFRRVHSMVAGN